MPRQSEDETIEALAAILRMGMPPHRDVDSYLCEVADRMEAAHASGVIKAMDELMGKD